jgi:TonB family protein
VSADDAETRSYALIAPRSGTYELVLDGKMTAKLSVDGRELDLDGLRAAGLLRSEGASQRVLLNEESRGMVHVGPYTVIFHFAEPVGAMAVEPLPAEFRANYLKNLDRLFATTLAAIAAVAILLIVWFYRQPQQAEVTFDTMDDRWAKLIVPDYIAEKPRPDEKPKGDQPLPKKDDPKERVAKVDDSDNAPPSKATRSEKIRKSIERSGVLAFLGTRGAGASGAVAEVFGDSDINSDLDSAFEGISGVSVASGSGRTSRGSGDGVAGGAASIGGIATSGGGQVGLGGKKEARVAAVKAEAPEVDGSLDGDAIAKVVRARLRSIQDCYEKELKRDPTLAGKIEIEFTIGAGGEVEDARVSSNKMGSAPVGDCIVSRVRRWRFPQPDGGRVTVNYPFIFTPSS